MASVDGDTPPVETSCQRGAARMHRAASHRHLHSVILLVCLTLTVLKGRGVSPFAFRPVSTPVMPRFSRSSHGN